MHLQEIIIHRLRDFDVIFRAKKKVKLLLYVMLRQIVIILRLNEKRIISLVPNNILKLRGKRFSTRKSTQDILFISKFYEPQTTKFLLSKKGEIFIDVGAHIGRFAVLCSQNFNKVYAFEPHNSNYSALVYNVGLNKIKNIFAFNNAVSSSNQQIEISSSGMNTGAVKITKKGTQKAKCITLDSFVIENNLTKKQCVVLLDVENHELSALQGSKKFLKNSNPVLIIETFNLNQIQKFLEKFGYSLTKKLDFYNYVFEKNNYFKFS